MAAAEPLIEGVADPEQTRRITAKDADLNDDSRDSDMVYFPATRCRWGDYRRFLLFAKRINVKPSKLARRRLFGRKIDPFFSETLRGIAVQLRQARFLAGNERAQRLEAIENHILDLIADYNGVAMESDPLDAV
jgi:hypothetical protein